MLDICDIVEGTDSPIFPVGVLRIFCFVGRDLELHSLVKIDSISESPRVKIYNKESVTCESVCHQVWRNTSARIPWKHQSCGWIGTPNQISLMI